MTTARPASAVCDPRQHDDRDDERRDEADEHRDATDIGGGNGVHAAFVGLELDDAGWRAVAIGERLQSGMRARAVELVVCATGDVTHTLTAEGHDASEDGTGRGTPIIAATLTAGTSRPGVSAPGRRQEDDINLVPSETTVRRLTPLECERLQGYPDGWTDVDGMSDSQRYRQMGNSVTVTVFEWVGLRLLAEDTRARRAA